MRYTVHQTILNATMSSLKRSRTFSLIPTQPSSDVTMVSSKKPKRKKLNRVTAIPTQIVAQSVRAGLVYSDTFNVSAALGTYQYREYNLNSCFDPQRSVGGHQPRGFDQYAALYAKYRVMNCKWKVSALAIDNTAFCVVVPSNHQLPTGDPTILQEWPGSDTKISQPITTGGVVPSFRGRCNLATLAGRTPAQYSADDVYGAAVGADPAEIIVLTLGNAEITGTAISNVRWLIRLEYDVVFYDPIQIGQS